MNEKWVEGVQAKQTYIACQVFYPDTQSTSRLLSDACGVIGMRGVHTIRVLCGYPRGPLERHLPKKETWSGVSIVRGGLRVDAKRGYALRALSYLGYCAFVARCVLTAPRESRFVVVTNPPFLPNIVMLLGRLRSHKVIIMLQDIYPDGLIQLNRIAAKGLLAGAWRWTNRRALAGASRVWVLGRDMAEYIEKHYQVAPSKITYVPHWSSIDVVKPISAERTQLFQRLDLNGKFIVQYAGNMGLWHDIDTIVRGARELQEDTRVEFLMIGSGIRMAAAQRLARNLGVKNIRWRPYVNDARELADALQCCHAAVISQAAGTEGIAVPCKLYGILASGRAVIAQVPRDSEVARVVHEERCGVVVAPGNVHAFVSAIRSLAFDGEGTIRLGAAAHRAYRAKYKTEDGAAIIEREISRL